uniref:Plastocyanin n=1 Tax=uncultured alpha proteobacterium HF0130_06E21 TaxID=710808 RepID=E0XT15_9PROT|nr:plastocyanin [uncultured alpha proteobacterium HF0130_06E21]
MKKLTLIFLTCLIFPSLSKVVLAETIQIEFTENDSYSLEVVRIEVGDTIEWLPTNKGHNVEFLAGPKMDLLPKRSKIDEVHSVVFKIPGVYVYGCTPHGSMGMLGLIIVGNDFHNIEKLKEIELSRVASSVLKRLIRVARAD